MYTLGKKLNRDFFLRDAVTVARELLGMHIVHETDGTLLVGEITETEAYNGLNDKACHSYGGRITPRTKVFYQLGGHGYVYFIYGKHHMFNVVTGDKKDPSGVLVRTCSVVEGREEIAMRRFGKGYETLNNARKKQLLNGPGNICQGLGIDRSHNSCNLLGKSLFLAKPWEKSEFDIAAGKRVNIDFAEEDADLPYRFTIVKPSPVPGVGRT